MLYAALSSSCLKFSGAIFGLISFGKLDETSESPIFRHSGGVKPFFSKRIPCLEYKIPLISVLDTSMLFLICLALLFGWFRRNETILVVVASIWGETIISMCEFSS